MKFSLIGTGFIFPTHVTAIQGVAGEIADVVNDQRSGDAWKDMVDTTEAECVVVLTPNDLHFEMAKRAAEKGKIVLCEKPLTIRSEHAEELSSSQNIFTVLQLRHHPVVRQLRSEIKGDETYNIEIDIFVHRDNVYYQGWKGQKERSGGVLFNLGIHYFDLLVHLFGKETNVATTYLDEKTGQGTIEGQNFQCSWRISTAATKENQYRIYKVNGVAYNFSSKDNLAYENLHGYVYQDILNNTGVTPQEEFHSIRLVEKLYEAYQK